MKLQLLIVAILAIVPIFAFEDKPQSSVGLRRVKDNGKGKGGTKGGARNGRKGSNGSGSSSKGSSKGRDAKGGNPKNKKRVRSARSPPDEEPVLVPETVAPYKCSPIQEPELDPVDIAEEPLVEPTFDSNDVPEEPLVEPVIDSVDVPEEPLVEPFFDSVDIPEDPLMDAPSENPTLAPIPVTDDPAPAPITIAPTAMLRTRYPTPAPVPVTDAPSERTEHPTPAPVPNTDAPTKPPTRKPTPAPVPVTDSPTKSPTKKPTPAPVPNTDAPTTFPTKNPTQSPVDIPVEPLEDEEQSNDDTLLEHICGILELVDAGAHKDPAILRSAITTSNPVLDFDWYNYCSGPPNHFLCPNEYETGKICARENPETSAAVLAAYCKPLFKPLPEDDYQKQCIEYCVNYVSLDRGACCNIDCPE